MAKVTGKEKKSFRRNLFVGIGTVKPIALNPTNEQLAILTNGVKSFDNPIKYVFTDSTGGTSYKLDIWCKLEYILGEADTIIQNADLNPKDVLVDYVCYSWWGRDKADIFYNEDGSVKGAWYVNSNTCEMEWVPENNIEQYLLNKRGKKTRVDFNASTTHIATQGEKDLYTFLEKLLRIEEIGVETPFRQVLNGNYKEINKVFQDTDRKIKLFFGIRETEDANYQSVYGQVFSQEAFNFNSLRDSLEKREWRDDKSGGDFTLRLYNPSMPAQNTVIEKPQPSSSGW